MKRLLSVLFLVAMAGVMFHVAPSFAYPQGGSALAVVAEMPAVGDFKHSLTANEAKGAVCQIGGNTFMRVINRSGATMTQGEPAWWQITGAYASVDAYSITTYEATGLFEDFAGIVICDDTGNTTIQANTTYASTTEGPGAGPTGWIMTHGFCYAWVTGEGAAVVVGDRLGGDLVTTHVLGRTRAKLTGTTSFEYSGCQMPIALLAQADGTKALAPIWIK